MTVSGRRRSIIFFISFGACCVALAAALNVGWVLLNWRAVVPLVLGVIFFLVIVTGLVLNTIFLVREIRRNEQHDAFINAVTHELKTPVASIRLYLQTLQSRDIDEDKQRHFYGIMLADTERLSHLIEQVLAAGMVGRAGRNRHRVRVEVSSLVAECVSLAATRHNLPPERLRFDSDGASHFVMADPEELKGAVMNLLDNAVKYSGDVVQVCASVRMQQGRAVIQVQDQGAGIAQDQLRLIFKRFYRVPGTMRVKGTGLGLFIVRSVAEQHGGKVFAESPGLGRGSTFTMLLPAI